MTKNVSGSDVIRLVIRYSDQTPFPFTEEEFDSIDDAVESLSRNHYHQDRLKSILASDNKAKIDFYRLEVDVTTVPWEIDRVLVFRVLVENLVIK